MYPEGSFLEQIFREFPDVTIRITSRGILASTKDLMVASFEDQPDDPTANRLWRYLQCIPDLM